MRIGGQASARLQLATEILQLLSADSSFHERARIDSRRRVSLKINRVAFELGCPRAEEMIESDFVQRGRGCVSRNMSANVVFFAIRAHHHRQGVPADQRLNAALQLLIAW